MNRKTNLFKKTESKKTDRKTRRFFEEKEKNITDMDFVARRTSGGVRRGGGVRQRAAATALVAAAAAAVGLGVARG